MDALGQGWIWGAVALAVGVPVLLVVLTEAIGVLQRRGDAAVRPLRLLRNWVVPVGALFGLLAFAVTSPADQVWLRVVATVLGFLLILLVLSAFNVALFANARTDTWRRRIPSIFVEIVRLLLVVVGVAILFAVVWNADVGGVIAALGVTSIVIGLALQNAVGGIISGLLLLFEQPFTLGDWLETGTVTGRIVEVNWRAVHIDTGSGIQILPNAALATGSFRNLSRPRGPHRLALAVAFAKTDPPDDVTALLVRVADALPMRVPGERAAVSYAGAGAYRVEIAVASPSAVTAATSVYLGWLWYAARRAGLSLDGATGGVEPDLAPAMAVATSALQLHSDDRPAIEQSARVERYGAGEIVLTTGRVPTEVRVVVAGSARQSVIVGGAAVELPALGEGELIGASALTREPARPCHHRRPRRAHRARDPGGRARRRRPRAPPPRAAAGPLARAHPHAGGRRRRRRVGGRDAGGRAGRRAPAVVSAHPARRGRSGRGRSIGWGVPPTTSREALRARHRDHRRPVGR